ncbi:MAG: adenylate/guanylate cyclase domain-containing protein [Pseudomonadales bacterium]
MPQSPQQRSAALDTDALRKHRPADSVLRARHVAAGRERKRNREGQHKLGRARKLWHLSFAFKIGLAMSALALLAAMLLVYLAVNQHWQLAQQQSDAFGQTIAEQLAGSLVESVFTDDLLAMQLNLNQLANKSVVESAAIYDASGVLVASAGVDTGRPAVLSGVATTRFNEELAVLPQGWYFAPVIFSGANAGYVVVAVDRAPLRAAFATSSNDLLLAVALIGALSVLGAYLLSRMLAKPVYRLLAVSEAARQGRLHSLPHLAKKSSMRNEWADIFSIYEQLGQEVKNKREIEKLFQQFVTPDVADHLLEADGQLRVAGESVQASVLFVDIVDFTRMAEPMSPQDVATMLNRYLSIFASCARIHRGIVDKFIGDAAMIVFGAPRKDENHRLNAMACALAIQSAARQINSKRATIGLKAIELRIGINTGKMRAGVLGSEYRKEFTVVGDAVNLASRLCNFASAGEIVVAESVYLPSREEVEACEAGEISVKGKSAPIRVYQLKSVRMTKNWVVTNLIEDLVAQH